MKEQPADSKTKTKDSLTNTNSTQGSTFNPLNQPELFERTIEQLKEKELKSNMKKGGRINDTNNNSKFNKNNHHTDKVNDSSFREGDSYGCNNIAVKNLLNSMGKKKEVLLTVGSFCDSSIETVWKNLTNIKLLELLDTSNGKITPKIKFMKGDNVCSKPCQFKYYNGSFAFVADLINLKNDLDEKELFFKIEILGLPDYIKNIYYAVKLFKVSTEVNVTGIFLQTFYLKDLETTKKIQNTENPTDSKFKKVLDFKCLQQYIMDENNKGEKEKSEFFLSIEDFIEEKIRNQIFLVFPKSLLLLKLTYDPVIIMESSIVPFNYMMVIKYCSDLTYLEKVLAYMVNIQEENNENGTQYKIYSKYTDLMWTYMTVKKVSIDHDEFSEIEFLNHGGFPVSAAKLSINLKVTALDVNSSFIIVTTKFLEKVSPNYVLAIKLICRRIYITILKNASKVEKYYKNKSSLKNNINNINNVNSIPKNE